MRIFTPTKVRLMMRVAATRRLSASATVPPPFCSRDALLKDSDTNKKEILDAVKGVCKYSPCTRPCMYSPCTRPCTASLSPAASLSPDASLSPLQRRGQVLAALMRTAMEGVTGHIVVQSLGFLQSMHGLFFGCVTLCISASAWVLQRVYPPSGDSPETKKLLVENIKKLEFDERSPMVVFWVFFSSG